MATSSRSTTRRRLSAKARHILQTGEAGIPFEKGIHGVMLKDIESQAAAIERAKKKLAEERGKLDELVAVAVSTQPWSVNWYDHAGALGGKHRDKLLKAAKMTPVTLHRVMDRFREGRKPTR